jgi:hypothetical protein
MRRHGRLEYLWHQVCADDSLALFCAYPKVGFTEDPSQSIAPRLRRAFQGARGLKLEA